MKLFFTFTIVSFAAVSGLAFSDGGSGGSGDPKTVPHYVENLVTTGQYAKANKKLKYFVRNEKGNFNAWKLLAISQLNTGKLEASLTSHKKALKLNRNHVGINLSLGELYLALGEDENANSQLEKLENLCGTCEEYLTLQQSISSAPESNS